MNGTEYDLPTVRKGSYILLTLTVMITLRIMYKGVGNSEALIVDALKALLTAVGATHGMLVLGGGFNNSKWSGPTSTVTKEITTTEKTTVPPSPAAVTVTTAAKTGVTTNVSN